MLSERAQKKSVENFLKFRPTLTTGLSGENPVLIRGDATSDSYVTPLQTSHDSHSNAAR
jgi:hypothetical protein